MIPPILIRIKNYEMTLIIAIHEYWIKRSEHFRIRRAKFSQTLLVKYIEREFEIDIKDNQLKKIDNRWHVDKKKHLSISNSYSDNFIAIGVLASDTYTNLGIDVENYKPDYAWLVNYYSDIEKKLLKTVQPSELNIEILKLWTRKESLVKSAGISLQEALITPSFSDQIECHNKNISLKTETFDNIVLSYCFQPNHHT